MGSRHAVLPIIAMTAHAMESERDNCLAAGMNDHITKPVDPDRLYAVLASWYAPPVDGTPAPKTKGRAKPRKGKKADRGKGPPASPPAPATEDGLPDVIAGIDMTEARAMMRGNDAFLRRLLGDFRANYMDQADKIAALLDAGDQEAAARVVHTLKGVSGNIRAERAYRAAKALDEQLRADPRAPEVGTHLAELGDALGEVSDALSDALTGSSSNPD